MKCDEIFAALALLEKERGIPQDFMMEKIVQAGCQHAPVIGHNLVSCRVLGAKKIARAILPTG